MSVRMVAEASDMKKRLKKHDGCREDGSSSKLLAGSEDEHHQAQ